MSFTKMVEDTWHCDPASIVSTLCFQKSNSSDSITSPCCGMGWQFRVSSDKTGAAPGQATLTRLFFDPQGFLRSLSPRNLKFSVIADPGTTVPSNYFVPSLDEFSSSGVELGTYSHPQNETMTFRITLYFSEGLKLKFSHAPQSSQDAPADMIDVMYDAVKGKEVVDCVFYLYSASAKGVKGQISKPRAVYANLALLRGHCTYLDALLGDGSQEALAVDSSQIAPVSWNYDYDSDSDFEEDLEDDSPETQNVNTNAATPDDANPISDAETVPGPTKEASKESSSQAVAPTSSQQFNRSMVLTSCAFRTWRSLVLYSTTQRITFRKLSSQHRRPLNQPSDPEDDACSPKSMYRLARMMGLEGLKKKAYSAITSSISQDNVIEELVSSFSVRYDRVRKFEIDHFLECNEKEFQAFCQKLSRGEFVAHQLPAVAEVFKALKEKSENIPAVHTPNPAPAPTLVTEKSYNSTVLNSISKSTEETSVSTSRGSAKSVKGGKKPYN